MSGIKLPDYTALTSPLPTPEAPTSVVSYTAGGPQEAAAAQDSALAKEGSDLQDLYAKSRVNDIYANDFSPKVRELAQQYYSLSGKDAVEQLPAYQKQIADLRNSTLEGMTGQEQEAFNPLATQRTEMELYRMTTKADYEGKQYAAQTHKAVLGNQIDEAATYYNDPNVFNHASQTGTAEISAYAAKTGQSPEYTQYETNDFNSRLQDARNGAIKDSISAMPGRQQLAILRPYIQKMGGSTADSGPNSTTPLPTNASDAADFAISKFEGTALVSNDGGKGASKFGIVGSQNGLTPDQVATLTPEDAKSIYKKDYWDKIGADNLPDNMKYIAFDTAVNMGPDTAKQMLAQSDGDPEKMLQLRQQKYDALVKNNPAKYGSYADGWQARQDTLAQSVGAPLTSPQAALVSNLSPKDVTGLYKQAVQQANEESLVQRADVTQKVQDNVASIAATGKPAVPLSNAEIQDAFIGNPEKAAELIKNLNWQKNFYDARTSMSLTSPSEDAQIINGNAPSGAGYADQAEMHDALIKAYTQKQKQVSDDPVQYVQQNSPNVQQLFQQSSQDPTKFPSYVSAVDQMQDKLGVQPWNRHVLTNGQASNLVDSIMSQPADKRAQQITSMANTYGDNWPRVMNDLVGAKLPAAYEVLAAVDNPVAKNALSEALGSGKNARGAIPEPDAKAIDKDVEGSADLDALAKSGSDLSGSTNKIAEIKSAVKLMAYSMSTTMGPAQAVKTAVASVTTDKYDFTSDNARVPKGTLSDTEDYGNQLMKNTKPEDLQQLPAPANMGFTGDKIQEITQQAMTDGRWATDEKVDGLVRLDTHGNPIMLKNGQRLGFKFSQVPKGFSSTLPTDQKLNPSFLERMQQGFEGLAN